MSASDEVAEGWLKGPASDEVERLIAEGRLKEAGRQVGIEIQQRWRIRDGKVESCGRPGAQPKPERRANRRTGGQWRKAEDWQPVTPEEFIISGMAKIEFIAGARARDVAIREEREHWLPRLEAWLSETPQTDAMVYWGLTNEIKRLRRALNLNVKPSPATVREQTRKRVKAYRERKRRRGGAGAMG